MHIGNGRHDLPHDVGAEELLQRLRLDLGGLDAVQQLPARAIVHHQVQKVVVLEEGVKLADMRVVHAAQMLNLGGQQLHGRRKLALVDEFDRAFRARLAVSRKLHLPVRSLAQRYALSEIEVGVQVLAFVKAIHFHHPYAAVLRKRALHLLPEKLVKRVGQEEILAALGLLIENALGEEVQGAADPEKRVHRRRQLRKRLLVNDACTVSGHIRGIPLEDVHRLDIDATLAQH
mmetsp:Transcript_111698/g.322842  ORF Transcript_111698/g.322842 Transcript_111698/m.322842 type:complete len:232 (-) Transcript_111698:658-1353(-)